MAVRLSIFHKKISRIEEMLGEFGKRFQIIYHIQTTNVVHQSASSFRRSLWAVFDVDVETDSSDSVSSTEYVG